MQSRSPSALNLVQFSFFFPALQAFCRFFRQSPSRFHCYECRFMDVAEKLFRVNRILWLYLPPEWKTYFLSWKRLHYHHFLGRNNNPTFIIQILDHRSFLKKILDKLSYFVLHLVLFINVLFTIKKSCFLPWP